MTIDVPFHHYTNIDLLEGTNYTLSSLSMYIYIKYHVCTVIFAWILYPPILEDSM